MSFIIEQELPQLPTGWIWKKVKDITEVVRGGSPRPKGDPKYFGGDIPWIMISDITREKGKYITKTKDTVTELGAKKSRYLERGSLILTNSGSICVPKILGVDGCIHDGFIAFLNLSKNLNQLFLYHYFDHIRPWVKQKHKQGVTQINLNTTIVKDFNVPFPPLSVQDLITQKIDELFSYLDAGLASLRHSKLLLNQYRQAVLKAAMTGELTKEWREKHLHELEPASILLEHILLERRQKWEEEQLAKFQAQGKIPKDDSWKKKYKEPIIAIDDNLPKIPNEWIWGSLSQLSIFKNGINFTKEQKGNKGILTIDVLNMYSQGLYINLDDVYRVNKEVSKGYILNSNDVLFVRSSVKREGVAWTSLFRPINEPVTYCGFIIRARLCTSKILPEYISHYCRNNYARSRLIGKAGQVTITNINQNSLGELEIPICCFSEQKEIVQEIERRFSIADKIEKQINNNIQLYNVLIQTILKSAFEGKLIQNNSSTYNKSNQTNTEEGETKTLKPKQTTLNGWKQNE